MNKNLIILVLAILLMAGGYYHFISTSNLKSELNQSVNLQSALTDTLRTYKDANGRYWNEKLSLQSKIKDLANKNLVLTDSQRELLNAITSISNDKEIIAAALIEAQIELAGLKNDKPVLTDTTVQFNHTSDSLTYDVLISDVKPLRKPVLTFNKFSIPNTSTVVFSWDKKRENYPVAFSISNSNPLFRVNDIQSYAIPELQKNTIKPSIWQKIKGIGKTSTGAGVLVGTGIIIGIMITK